MLVARLLTQSRLYLNKKKRGDTNSAVALGARRPSHSPQIGGLAGTEAEHEAATGTYNLAVRKSPSIRKPHFGCLHR